jgi:hypothetical protein
VARRLLTARARYGKARPRLILAYAITINAAVFSAWRFGGQPV